MRRGVSVGGQAVLLALTGFQLLAVPPPAWAQGQSKLVCAHTRVRRIFNTADFGPSNWGRERENSERIILQCWGMEASIIL